MRIVTFESARTRRAIFASTWNVTRISGFVGSGGSATSSTEPTTTPLSHTGAPATKPPTWTNCAWRLTCRTNSCCFLPISSTETPNSAIRPAVNRPTRSRRRGSVSSMNTSSAHEVADQAVGPRGFVDRPHEGEAALVEERDPATEHLRGGQVVGDDE